MQELRKDSSIWSFVQGKFLSAQQELRGRNRERERERDLEKEMVRKKK